MPLATITDWANGPMGPGFFLLFRANVDIFYDGGGFFELIGRPPETGEREKQLGELVALILLMRMQHDPC